MGIGVGVPDREKFQLTPVSRFYNKDDLYWSKMFQFNKLPDHHEDVLQREVFKNFDNVLDLMFDKTKTTRSDTAQMNHEVRAEIEKENLYEQQLLKDEEEARAMGENVSEEAEGTSS